MDTPRIKEQLSFDNFVDEEGDVKSAADLGEGAIFDTSDEPGFVPPATLNANEHNYVGLAEPQVEAGLPVRLEGSYPSVELGKYAANLSQSLESYAYMNKRKGMVHSGDTVKIKHFGGEEEILGRADGSEKAGDIFFAKAYGEAALLAAGVNSDAIKKDMQKAKEELIRKYLGTENASRRKTYYSRLKRLTTLKNNPSS